MFGLAMKKEKVISIINSAIESHAVWIDHGQILIDGLNLENAQAPLNCDDCEFHLWFNSNGTRLRNFSWYNEVNEIHAKYHKSYSTLYYESMRMYNPKTRAELIERFDDLELQSNLYQELLKEVRDELSHMEEADYEKKLVEEDTQSLACDNSQVATQVTESAEANEAKPNKDTKESSETDVSAETNEKQEIDALKADLAKPVVFGDNEEADKTHDDTNKANTHNEKAIHIPEYAVVEMKLEPSGLSKSTQNKTASELSEAVSVVEKSVSVKHPNPEQQRQILKQQDIKQLEQEIKLTQLELDQFKERQKLTRQSIQQLEQYYLLKNQEIEIDQHEYAELEAKKLEIKEQKEKELAELNQRTRRKIQELDQLEMMDQKLERKKEQSIGFEKKQIAQLDEQKANKLEDIKQIDKYLDLRQMDLQKLKEQVALVEQDIANLELQKNNKNKDLEAISEKKKMKIEQSDLEFQKQQQLDRHKAEVQKEKQKELNELEQQQQACKDELQEVRQELVVLEQKKIELKAVKQREIKELEEQQEAKQEALRKIEENQQLKRREIKELELRQGQIKASLKEIQIKEDAMV